MKRILLVTRPIIPPWDEASKNLAKSLALNIKGYTLTLLTCGRVSELPKNVSQLPLYTQGGLDMRITQKLRLLKLFSKRNNFDIIHYMLTPTKLNSYSTRTILRSKTAKTIQSIATLRDDKYSMSSMKKILFADLLITYSDFTKDKLEKWGFKNVIRIYPGIDIEHFKPSPKDIKFLHSFGIKETDFVVTCPGEYTRMGATDTIVNMLPNLSKKIPNLKFIFAYRIKHSADLEKKKSVVSTLHKQGLKDKVIFTDTVKDMASLYNASDIIIFPAITMHGKFDVPLAVIEAMSCARPVIVNSLPVLAEFTNVNNSIPVAPGSPQDIADEILQLYKDPEGCKKIGDSARKYVINNFDITAVSKQYKQAYESLLRTT